MVEQQQRHDPPFDGVDFTLMLATAIVPPHWPFALLLAVTTLARRSPKMCGYVLDALGWEPDAEFARTLLPGAVKLLPEASNVVETGEPGDEWNTVETKTNSATVMRRAVKALPTQVRIADVRPFPKSSTSLPLGIDSLGKPQYIDLLHNTLHVGLYGSSGCGKDTLLRLWFIVLTKRNSPDALQFAVLDGKGDWLTPNLRQLAHMWIQPAGGFGATGKAAILDAIKHIEQEAERRQQLIVNSGYRNREAYNAATGERLPLLIVMITDGMDNVQGEVETMLTSLVSKARALGIRVIVSMQTPTKRDTRWRSNLSTVLAGPLQDRSQDAPAMGMREDSIVYRPSLLPSPQKRQGVFVLRAGSEQDLIQSPYISDEHFDHLCESLPQRTQPVEAPTRVNDDALLSNLLAGMGVGEAVTTTAAGNEANTAPAGEVRNENLVSNVVVTPSEVAQIATLLTAHSPSDVAKKLYGYTPSRYAEFKAKVDAVKSMLNKESDQK